MRKAAICSLTILNNMKRRIMAKASVNSLKKTSFNTKQLKLISLALPTSIHLASPKMGKTFSAMKFYHAMLKLKNKGFINSKCCCSKIRIYSGVVTLKIIHSFLHYWNRVLAAPIDLET